MESRNIVVAVDGSPESDRAAVWAAREAATTGAELFVVSAWTPTPLAYLGDGGPAVGPHEQAARAAVGRGTAAARAAEPDVVVVAEALRGPVARTLVEVSAGAELVVLGAAPVSSVRRALGGSVTTHVSAHAVCPVVTVRGPAGDLSGGSAQPVVVGVDGSRSSCDAIGFAIEYADRHRLEVVALKAWSPADSDPFGSRSLGGAPSYERACLEVAESVAGWTQQYPDVKVTVAVRDAHPVVALVDAAEHAALVVVGSHGYGWFREMVIGSVSAALVHESPSSVVVVRSRADRSRRWFSAR